MDARLRCPPWSMLALPAWLALCAAGGSVPLTGKDLAVALSRGGYVILMRHASSPGTPPDPAHVDPDNVNDERQLDEAGRTSARAMGESFQQLRIKIGQVLSSPAYRALETARLAGFGAPQPLAQLGDAGHGPNSDTGATPGAWLRAKVAQAPKAGTNTLIITHAPNIGEAFPAESADLAEGGALIFRPDGRGGASLVARVKIQEWPQLADAR